ncbi:hypothetical protein Peur_007060 [Populus x canadensis]
MCQNEATAEYPYPSEWNPQPAGRIQSMDDHQSTQQNPIPVKTKSTGWGGCLGACF